MVFVVSTDGEIHHTYMDTSVDNHACAKMKQNPEGMPTNEAFDNTYEAPMKGMDVCKMHRSHRYRI